MKLKCIKCNELATWFYMPSDRDKNYCFCDSCVPRGCDCNLLISEDLGFIFDEDGPVEEKDEKGRLLPCCEYNFFEEGIDCDEEYDT